MTEFEPDPERQRAHIVGEALVATLDEAGLTTAPVEFVARIREALRDLRGPIIGWDPSEQFDTAASDLLGEGGLDLSPPRTDEPDPISETLSMYVALLAESMDVAGASQRLGVDDSRIRQRLRARTLFGIREEEGWRIPLAQFDEDGEVRGLGQVLSTLRPGLHPVSVWRWLTLPNTELEIDDRRVSPVVWLRSGGDIQRARSVAADL